MKALESIRNSSISQAVPCHQNGHSLKKRTSSINYITVSTSVNLEDMNHIDQLPSSKKVKPKNVYHYRSINDPIHGTIRLNKTCSLIVDTPEFQRLRYLKQCGPCYFVYPSANHTRFDHSLGVYHLASQVVRNLRGLEGDKVELKESDMLCVEIAALCHDLGHGPFSHFWERFVADKKFKHEDMSLKIFENMINNNSILRKELSEEDREFIKELILPPPAEERNKRKRQFLYEIVNNMESKVDVDKMDYMLRDAHMFGITPAVEPHRILAEVVVMDDHLYYPLKLADSFEEIFTFRNKMFLHAYQHGAAVSIEIMFQDALRMVDEEMGNLLFQGLFKKPLKLSDAHQNIEAYLLLNDSIFQMIELLSEKLGEGGIKAKELLRRIHLRDIYPCVKEDDMETDEDIEKKKDEMRQKYKVDKVKHCKAGSIQKKDPLSGIKFFNRQGETCLPLKKMKKSSVPIFFIPITHKR